MNIREILGLPDVLNVRKVIAVQPHPDDNEVNIGGTLLELSKRGCEIVYVTVTDGRAGAWGNVAEASEIVRVRQGEKESAGTIIGVSRQIDLGFPDGGPYSISEATTRLVQIYRKEKPDLILAPDPWMPYEAHPDHVKVGHAAAHALLFSNNAILYPVTDGLDPVQVQQIALYATSYPNTWVDITEHFQHKIDAVFSHRSQFDNETWPFVQMYFSEIAKAAYQHISTAETGFAESLKVLAHLQLHAMPETLYR